MTKEQAKETLSVYRPGTDDAGDPLFAEALEFARQNPEVSAWLAESTTFDARVCRDLARVPAPVGLRQSILATRKIIRPTPWWQHQISRRQMAAAAALILTGLIGSFWIGRSPKTFADFSREIVDQAWGSSPHVEARAADLRDIRDFLVSENISTNFSVPSVLAQSTVQGCTVVNWRGHRIPVLCFFSDGQHLHLAIVDRSLFPDAPDVPETDRWLSWRMASWSKNGHTYVLTGLTTASFVKKFRKEKRWDWEG